VTYNGDMVTNYVQLKINSENEVQALAQNIFQRCITEEEYAWLAGAQPGDNVVVSLKYDKEISYIELWMTRPVSVGRRSLYIGMASALFKGGKGPLLTIQLIKIPQELRGQGIGPDIIATQIKAAQRVGISQIDGYADNEEYLPGRRHIGYYVLPRLGFDAQLTDDQKQKLPAELANKGSISEIMRDDKTRKTWRENGLPMYVTFDTSANSSSVHTLQDYLKEKGRSWESIRDTPPQVLRVTKMPS